MTDAAARRLLSVDFEIFGRVQGVFFRKYTQHEATRLQLVGWCANTHSDTVKGQVQGDQARIAEMKNWLRNVGSPHSHITNAVFSNERTLEKLDYANFSVAH